MKLVDLVIQYLRPGARPGAGELLPHWHEHETRYNPYGVELGPLQGVGGRGGGYSSGGGRKGGRGHCTVGGRFQRYPTATNSPLWVNSLCSRTEASFD